jgi:hypothetical protein
MLRRTISGYSHVVVQEATAAMLNFSYSSDSLLSVWRGLSGITGSVRIDPLAWGQPPLPNHVNRWAWGGRVRDSESLTIRGEIRR